MAQHHQTSQSWNGAENTFDVNSGSSLKKLKILVLNKLVNPKIHKTQVIVLPVQQTHTPSSKNIIYFICASITSSQAHIVISFLLNPAMKGMSQHSIDSVTNHIPRLNLVDKHLYSRKFREIYTIPNEVTKILPILI
jgi:hypothetical protein